MGDAELLRQAALDEALFAGPEPAGDLPTGIYNGRACTIAQWPQEAECLTRVNGYVPEASYVFLRFMDTAAWEAATQTVRSDNGNLQYANHQPDEVDAPAPEPVVGPSADGEEAADAPTEAEDEEVAIPAHTHIFDERPCNVEEVTEQR